MRARSNARSLTSLYTHSLGVVLGIVGWLMIFGAANGEGLPHDLRAELSGAQLDFIRGSASHVLTARAVKREEIKGELAPIRAAVDALRDSLVELAAPISNVRLFASPGQNSAAPSDLSPPVGSIASLGIGAAAPDPWAVAKSDQIEAARSRAAVLDALVTATPSLSTPTSGAMSAQVAVSSASAPESVAPSIPEPALRRLRALPAELEFALELPEQQRQLRIMELSNQLRTAPPLRSGRPADAAAPTPSITSRTRHRTPVD